MRLVKGQRVNSRKRGRKLKDLPEPRENVDRLDTKDIRGLLGRPLPGRGCKDIVNGYSRDTENGIRRNINSPDS